MGVYNNGAIVLVNGGTARPTHGDYVLGTLLYDDNSGEKRWYVCTSITEPVAWSRLPNNWNVDRDITENKYGQYIANSMICRGEGMMQDVQPVGATFNTNGADGSGTLHSFTTGSSITQNAGLVILRPVGSFAGFTRPGFLPYYKFKQAIPARTAGDLRFYSGFPTTNAGILLGEAPIDQANGGIVVGFNSTDTNFNIWHGDATAAISKVETTPVIPVPAVLGSYKVEIIFVTSISAIVTIYNGTTNAVLGTALITTNLPLSTKAMNWQNIIQNPIAATNKTLTVYAGYMGAIR